MKIKVVRLNETRDFNLTQNDQEEIEAIFSVYLYTPDSVTHCCELTPSYDLSYLYTYVTTKIEVSDERRDGLDETYCHEGGEDVYMHCHVADRLPDQKDCGEFESIDEAREHLIGNWPL